MCFNLVPRTFSPFQMAVGETPGQGCQSGSKNSLEFRHINMTICLCFVWTMVSDSCRKQTEPKKPFHHVSSDKILHDSWSISAALARGFSDHHFEWGEGPGDEVGCVSQYFALHCLWLTGNRCCQAWLPSSWVWTQPMACLVFKATDKVTRPSGKGHIFKGWLVEGEKYKNCYIHSPRGEEIKD